MKIYILTIAVILIVLVIPSQTEACIIQGHVEKKIAISLGDNTENKNLSIEQDKKKVYNFLNILAIFETLLIYKLHQKDDDQKKNIWKVDQEMYENYIFRRARYRTEYTYGTSLEYKFKKIYDLSKKVYQDISYLNLDYFSIQEVFNKLKSNIVTDLILMGLSNLHQQIRYNTCSCKELIN